MHSILSWVYRELTLVFVLGKSTVGFPDTAGIYIEHCIVPIFLMHGWAKARALWPSRQVRALRIER